MKYRIAAAVLLTVLAGALYERRAEARFRRSARFWPPGRFVTVSGRRIHLIAAGQRRPGQPLIVLEAGHGAWSACWQPVMAGLAPHARVVAVDRAGYAFSGPGPEPRTPAQMVADLRSALLAAGEPGPYLLVGHSMGASIARLFASQQPGEVTGMVWVDPVHEDLARYLPLGRVIAPAVYGGLRLGALLARLGILRASGFAHRLARYPAVGPGHEQDLLFELVAAPAYLDTLAAETRVLFGSRGWPDAPGVFDSLPIISLEAQYSAAPPAGYPAWYWRRFRAGWRAMQADLARRSGSVRRVPVAAGHNIHVEQPGQVIAAVLAMLPGEPAPAP